MVDGAIRRGTRIRMMATGKESEVMRLAVFSPQLKEIKDLSFNPVSL